LGLSRFLMHARASLALWLFFLGALCGAVSASAFQFDPAAIRGVALALYGNAGTARVDAWLAMLDSSSHLSDIEKLRRVNLFWNTAVSQAEDRDVWQLEDYWATPLESLGRGLGDCEDFVIAKYFSLLRLGVPANRLRLIYVRAQQRVDGRLQAIPHMVLGYYSAPDAEPLVLDSLRDDIRKGGERADLAPVFSFNAEGIFLRGTESGSVDQIGRWRGLVARLRAQGFEP
jgi:predicted transglutaminase-like cysteine proteinase